MSKDTEAVQAINRLAKDGFDLLGSTDGPALMGFLEDYFCGEEDPGNQSPGKHKSSVHFSFTL